MAKSDSTKNGLPGGAFLAVQVSPLFANESRGCVFGQRGPVCGQARSVGVRFWRGFEFCVISPDRYIASIFI